MLFLAPISNQVIFNKVHAPTIWFFYLFKVMGGGGWVGCKDILKTFINLLKVVTIYIKIVFLPTLS